MIGLNIDKHFYADTLGVSCVEKSLLGYLHYLKFPYQCLFYESYISANDVLDEFLNNKVSYIAYSGIKRLQKVANDLHIAQTTYFEKPFDEMLDIAHDELAKETPLLLRVKSEKLPNTKAIPWADEHFILLYKIDGVYYLLNQYPLCEYKMSRVELAHVYDGAMLVISVTPDFNKAYYKDSIKSGIVSITGSKECQFYYDVNDDNIEHLRNAIGILKMSRSQIMEWAQWINSYYDFTYFPQESITLLSLAVENLNKLYTAIEYYRFRKYNIQYINDMLKVIIQDENSFRKQNFIYEEN